MKRNVEIKMMEDRGANHRVEATGGPTGERRIVEAIVGSRAGAARRSPGDGTPS